MTDKSKLLILIIFNLSLMFLEIAGGIISGSLALLSDAGHMLADTTALFVSYVAIFISSKLPTPRKTFGYKRAEVLAALFNGALLVVLAVIIFYEAIVRLWHPVEIKTFTMLVIAAVGLVGNLAGIFLLRARHHHSDDDKSHPHIGNGENLSGIENINIRGAYYHLFSDMLSSVGVLSGAIVIRWTGFYQIDSLLGVVISFLIVKNAARLLRESLDILMESTPSDIDIKDLSLSVKDAVKGVKSFHDVHIWSISTDKRSLSAHVELSEDIPVSETQDKVLSDIRKYLLNKYNIYHTTLEVECGGCHYGTDKSKEGCCYL